MTAGTKRKILYLCLFAVMFAVTFTITYSGPLISDDFEFADLHYTSLGDVLRFSLHYGNGRLLGNVGAVYLINFPILNATVKAAVLSGITLLLPMALGCADGKMEHVFVMTVLTFAAGLGMNPTIFAQVVTWTSGFANYFPPILCLLICMTVVRTCGDRKRWRYIVLLIVGIAGQLYVEHSTIVNAGMALWYCIRCRDQERERCARVWLLASVAGALIMVLIPVLFPAAINRTEGYRSVNLGSVQALIGSVTFCVSELITVFSGCFVLWILFSLFGILTVPDSTFCRKHPFLRRLSLYILAVYPVISVVFRLTEDMTMPAVKIFRYGFAYCGLFLYLGILLLCVLTLEDRKTKVQLLSCVFFAALSVAPFLIVSPFQTRCMLLAYYLLTMAAVKGIDHRISERKWNFSLGHMAVLSAAVGCLVLYLELDFAETRALTRQRTAYVESCMDKGERSICIYVMPSKYAGYDGGMAEYYFYYQERGDIAFETVAYDLWVDLGYGQMIK